MSATTAVPPRGGGGLTRRRTLAAGAGVAVAALGTGAAAVASADAADLVRAVLRRTVGPFRMEEAEFRRFVAAFGARGGIPPGLRGDLAHAAERTGLTPALLSVLPPGSRAAWAAFERALVTAFFVNTSFGTSHTSPAGPYAEPVVFLGVPEEGEGCRNPFARFDDDATPALAPAPTA